MEHRNKDHRRCSPGALIRTRPLDAHRCRGNQNPGLGARAPTDAPAGIETQSPYRSRSSSERGTTKAPHLGRGALNAQTVSDARAAWERVTAWVADLPVDHTNLQDARGNLAVALGAFGRLEDGTARYGLRDFGAWVLTGDPR
jgi:hypothetical protein